MKRLTLLLALIISIHVASIAATVDSIAVPSRAMNRTFSCVVIKPNTYKKAKARQYPVVYLLHGYGGGFSNWIIRVPELKDLADREQLLIVCPEGASSSWYWDSPIDSTLRFETYVSQEVPDHIDQQYRTIANRNGRAITGLSMGGHGGIFLGFRHADRFGACGSMSGAVDLSFSRNKYDITKRIGDTLSQAANTFSAIAALDTPPQQALAVIVDCGLQDYFIQANRNLHEKMMKQGLPHDYIERPGKHDWNYWRNAVPYQMLFFSRYFKQANSPGK